MEEKKGSGKKLGVNKVRKKLKGTLNLTELEHSAHYCGTHTRARARANARMHACTHAHTHARARTCIHTNTRACTHARTFR